VTAVQSSIGHRASLFWAGPGLGQSWMTKQVGRGEGVSEPTALITHHTEFTSMAVCWGDAVYFTLSSAALAEG